MNSYSIELFWPWLWNPFYLFFALCFIYVSPLFHTFIQQKRSVASVAPTPLHLISIAAVLTSATAAYI